MQTAENKLIFENKYDIIILLSAAHPHTGQAVGEGDILRDGKQPKNDLETTKAFSPRTTPIPILRKRKKKILILIRFAWRRDLRREKVFFSGKGRSAGTPPHWAATWLHGRGRAAPLLKKS